MSKYRLECNVLGFYWIIFVVDSDVDPPVAGCKALQIATVILILIIMKTSIICPAPKPSPIDVIITIVSILVVVIHIFKKK